MTNHCKLNVVETPIQRSPRNIELYKDCNDIQHYSLMNTQTKNMETHVSYKSDVYSGRCIHAVIGDYKIGNINNNIITLVNKD